MKTKKLLSEPTYAEVMLQTDRTHCVAIDLLVLLRKACGLTIKQAALLLEVGRHRLNKYEQKEKGMTHKSYCKHISCYIIYIRFNNLKMPEGTEGICNYFVSETTQI